MYCTVTPQKHQSLVHTDTHTHTHTHTSTRHIYNIQCLRHLLSSVTAARSNLESFHWETKIEFPFDIFLVVFPSFWVFGYFLGSPWSSLNRKSGTILCRVKSLMWSVMDDVWCWLELVWLCVKWCIFTCTFIAQVFDWFNSRIKGLDKVR